MTDGSKSWDAHSAERQGPTFNHTTYKGYELDGWKFLDTSDQDIGFLVNSPSPVAFATMVYLLIVCFIGPLYMKSRQPYKLSTTIRLYNLLMVFLAAYLVKNLYNAIGSIGNLFQCDKTFNLVDGSSDLLYRNANFLLAVRLSEYFDTFCFTLRKKYQQITFLHVFHHAIVPIYAYWVMRTGPCRFNAFIMILNSFIHVMMYSYYFLSTFQTSTSNSASNESNQSIVTNIISKLLLFKRYMTQLQILQFVMLTVYVIWAAFQPNQCNVPRQFLYANLGLGLGFLVLFLHFYFQAYSRRPDKTQGTKKRV